MRPEAFLHRLVESYERHLRTGKPPYDMPEGGLELWNIFMQIGATRTQGAHGPQALAYQEIEAWSRLHRWPLLPQHLSTIRALDEAWLRHQYAKLGGTVQPVAARRHAQPVNSAAFDAVFG